MVRICLMASLGYQPGLVIHPEQGIPRIPKDCHLRDPEVRQGLMRSRSLAIGSYQNEEPWKPVGGLFDNKEFIKIDSTIKRPVFLDAQVNHPNSTLFSYGIAKQCTRHEEILKLISGSDEVERDGLNLSILSDLMGLEAVTMDLSQQALVPDQKPSFCDTEPEILYPDSELDSPKPLMDFVGDLIRRSELTVHQDGRVTISGTGTEMKDLVSVLSEFYLSKNSTKWRKQSFLVPQFNRFDSTELKAHGSTLELEPLTYAPLKCPEKVKLPPSPKKKNNRKAAKGRDLYSRNSFQACESLLSLIIDKNRNGKAAFIPELKKSGPELPQLLTQFSASIAGTGIALLFSVVCKVASGRVPFCTSKALNTGLGIGLVWLSWSVNRLGDTIIAISKNSGKKGMKEEEMARNLDRSVKEIYFRAATLMAVVVLRFA